MYYILILLSLVLILYNKKNIFFHKLLGNSLIVLVFAAGIFRDTTIGTDLMQSSSGGYFQMWQNIYSADTRIEPGFVWFTKIVRIIPSFYFYYGLIFFINILCYFKAAEKLNISKPLLAAFLVLTFFLFNSYNIIRQMMGLGLCVYIVACFVSEQEKKIKEYILYLTEIIAVTFLIHKSLFILILVPLLDIKYIQNKLDNKLILWSILFFSLLFSSMLRSQIDEIIFNYSYLLGDRGEFWADVHEMYHNEDSEKTLNFIIANLVTGFLYIQLSAKRNTIFYIAFGAYIIHVVIGDSMGVIGRVLLNLNIFSCFFFAENWWSMINTYKGKPFTYYLTFFVILFKIALWVNALNGALLSNSQLFPYKTYLF